MINTIEYVNIINTIEYVNIISSLMDDHDKQSPSFAREVRVQSND